MERKHRHISEVARALRFQSGLSLTHWGDCVLTTVYIINRLPNVALNFTTPYEKLFKEKVDYDRMKVFGCLAFAHNSARGSDKFAPRGIACAFIRYPSNTKGYRLLNISTMQSLISRNVIFHEDVFSLNVNSNKPYMKPLPTVMPLTDPEQYSEEIVNEEVGEKDTSPHTQLNQEMGTMEVNAGGDEIGDGTDGMCPEESQEMVQKRPTRQSKQPAWMEDFVTPYSKSAMTSTTVAPQDISRGFHCFLAAIVPRTDPQFFHQAMKIPHWVDVMNQELEALEKNHTWDVTTLPPNRKSIESK